MAAEVERLVDHVVPDHGDEGDVSRVRIHRHADEPGDEPARGQQHDQHAPREEHDAEFTHGVDRGIVVGEVLVVLARVPVVDRAHREDVEQPVHHGPVHATTRRSCRRWRRERRRATPRWRPACGVTQHAITAMPVAYITPTWTSPWYQRADLRDVLLPEPALPFGHHGAASSGRHFLRETPGPPCGIIPAIAISLHGSPDDTTRTSFSISRASPRRSCVRARPCRPRAKTDPRAVKPAGKRWRETSVPQHPEVFPPPRSRDGAPSHLKTSNTWRHCWQT